MTAGTFAALPETTVHLLRHGEVDNPDGIIYGRLPGYGLSVRGRGMATAAAAALAGRDIVAVWCSPLQRARETAAPVAATWGLPVRLDERLVEPRNDFQGLRVAVGDGALGDPRRWWWLRNPFRPSWGEPYTEIAARMSAAVADARDAHRGREVVLVSHQLAIWSVRRSIEGRRLWHRPDRRQCALASITALTYRGDEVVRVTYTEPAGRVAPPAPAGA